MNILPIKDDIQTYFWVVFGYLDGLIPLRSFAEKGNSSNKPPTNIWIKADDFMASKALNFANTANQRQAAFYVVPAIVEQCGQASSNNIKQMQVLLIDIDDGDIEGKLLLLEQTLGQATMIIESGGVTCEGLAKIHVYWQLTKAIEGEQLKQLLKLRYQIAHIFGGDTHFKSAHQPIRVAGSVYHKGGIAKLVKIRAYEPVEYELEQLIELVKELPRNNLTNNNFTTTSALPINKILTEKVYEGGIGEQTRFNHLSRVIGYWLRRCHDGLISEDKAIEEIYSYNLANVLPAWSIDKIKQMVNGLWKVHIEKYGTPKQQPQQITNTVVSFSLGNFLTDHSQLPQDIIAPRILTPSGILVFGGAPKVGKSDFLLSLFVHMSAGKEFVGFKPARALRIFYLQTEIGYHYMRERLQNIQLPKELLAKAETNLHITANNRLLLDEQGVNMAAKHIRQIFPEHPPDIIAIDPIRNSFDGGRHGSTENENDAMMFFLQNRIELLKDKINPHTGTILVHHTKKISRIQFEEDPFQAFSGASSLRGYYTSGILLYKPEIDSNNRHLIFELRNGKEIGNKIIRKVSGIWEELNPMEKRIAYKVKGKLYDRERERRIKVIIKLLEADALKGKFYLMKQFAQKYQNYIDLGCRRAIYDDCSVAATQGVIKFFDNPEEYGIKLASVANASFGYICTENMMMEKGEVINIETGETIKNYIQIPPTHYKCDGDGRKKKVLNNNNWQTDLEKIGENTVNKTSLKCSS